MTILLAALAAAFAALCIWLTVRIVNRRERWAKWTIAGLILVSACLAVWWMTSPQEGILFDPIEMRSEMNSSQ